MASNKSVKKMTATASFVQATDASSGTGAKTIADTMSIPIGAVVTACITVPSVSSNSGDNNETGTITVGGISVSAALNQAAMAAGNVNTDTLGGVTTTNANIGLTVGTTAFSAGSMDIIIEYYLLD
tara:strand:- start:3983 stop:4360 length:378 start_codon:yes stop_codon:yes gene_type:complete